jgi:tetratricopeptide (TPR) repeat protein
MRAVAETLYFWGDLATDCGEFQSARRQLEECLSACEQIGDTYLRAFPLVTLARVACAEGDIAQARAYAQEGLALRSAEFSWGWLRAVSLNALGEVERCAENNDQAAALFNEALAIYQARADEPGIAWTRHNLGYVALRAGETQRAIELFSQALTARARHRYFLGVAADLAGLASVARALERPAPAARLFGAADALLRRIGLVLAPVDALAFDRDLASARAALDSAAFAGAWDAGAVLTMEDAIAEALAEARRGV